MTYLEGVRNFLQLHVVQFCHLLSQIESVYFKRKKKDEIKVYWVKLVLSHETVNVVPRTFVKYGTVKCFPVDTLKHFTRLKKTVVPGFERHPLRGLSVDECAARCLSNIAFECESFQYCADIGVCTLSDTHPADSLASSSYHRMCDIFASKWAPSSEQALSLSNFFFYAYFSWAHFCLINGI